MSVDKLVDSAQLDSDLTSVANAIRTKGGTSAQLAFPADFITAINAISGGGMPDSGSITCGSFTANWALVTVGSGNGITSTQGLLNYLRTAVGLTSSFSSLMFFYSCTALPASPVTNFVSGRNATYVSGSSTQAYRYKNGSYTSVQISSSYDASIPVGTQYRVWWFAGN